jgi:hypothetical protein
VVRMFPAGLHVGHRLLVVWFWLHIANSIDKK